MKRKNLVILCRKFPNTVGCNKKGRGCKSSFCHVTVKYACTRLIDDSASPLFSITWIYLPACNTIFLRNLETNRHGHWRKIVFVDMKNVYIPEVAFITILNTLKLFGIWPAAVKQPILKYKNICKKYIKVRNRFNTCIICLK